MYWNITADTIARLSAKYCTTLPINLPQLQQIVNNSQKNNQGCHLATNWPIRRLTLGEEVRISIVTNMAAKWQPHFGPRMPLAKILASIISIPCIGICTRDQTVVTENDIYMDAIIYSVKFNWLLMKIHTLSTFNF